MPSVFDEPAQPVTRRSSVFDDPVSAGSSIRSSVFDEPETSGTDETSPYGIGAAVAGAVGLGAAGYYAYKHPTSIPGKVLNYLNAARQQLMLSGLALPKSMLGNAGAVVSRSLEEGSTKPLTEFFSPQTWQDAKAAYKAGSSVGPTMGSMAGTTIPGPMPGRMMGALDSATQGALQRSGMTAKESAAALFQTPLGENFGKLSEALDSPAAKYVFPFRRTPYNQFYEGLQTVKPGFKYPGVRNAYMAAGALHGAATSDEQYPVTLPLATAASARYGVPYAAAALLGRYLASGRGGGGIAGSMLPASEYGTEQSLTDPLSPFTNPSAARVLKKFGITN